MVVSSRYCLGSVGSCWKVVGRSVDERRKKKLLLLFIQIQNDGKRKGRERVTRSLLRCRRRVCGVWFVRWPVWGYLLVLASHPIPEDQNIDQML